MKYLLVLLVIVLVVWVATASRRRLPQSDARKPKTEKSPAALEDMVSCAHCGLNLPRSEALPGRGGFFCDAAHRAAHEAEPPR